MGAIITPHDDQPDDQPDVQPDVQPDDQPDVQPDVGSNKEHRVIYQAEEEVEEEIQAFLQRIDKLQDVLRNLSVQLQQSIRFRDVRQAKETSEAKKHIQSSFQRLREKLNEKESALLRQLQPVECEHDVDADDEKHMEGNDHHLISAVAQDMNETRSCLRASHSEWKSVINNENCKDKEQRRRRKESILKIGEVSRSKCAQFDAMTAKKIGQIEDEIRKNNGCIPNVDSVLLYEEMVQEMGQQALEEMKEEQRRPMQSNDSWVSKFQPRPVAIITFIVKHAANLMYGLAHKAVLFAISKIRTRTPWTRWIGLTLVFCFGSWYAWREAIIIRSASLGATRVLRDDALGSDFISHLILVINMLPPKHQWNLGTLIAWECGAVYVFGFSGFSFHLDVLCVSERNYLVYLCDAIFVYFSWNWNRNLKSYLIAQTCFAIIFVGEWTSSTHDYCAESITENNLWLCLTSPAFLMQYWYYMHLFEQFHT